MDREIDARFLICGEKEDQIHDMKKQFQMLRFLHAYIALPTHLILVDFPVLKLRLALLLERDDNEGDEDVDEEEGEDDEEHNVEDRHLYPKQGDRSLILVGRSHGVLKNTAKNT